MRCKIYRVNKIEDYVSWFQEILKLKHHLQELKVFSRSSHIRRYIALASHACPCSWFQCVMAPSKNHHAPSWEIMQAHASGNSFKNRFMHCRVHGQMMTKRRGDFTDTVTDVWTVNYHHHYVRMYGFRMAIIKEKSSVVHMHQTD